jgi:hypothetical protein
MSHRIFNLPHFVGIFISKEVFMIIDVKILENSSLFTIRFSRWGNVRKADKSLIQADSEKRMLKLSKNLVESPEYEKICNFHNQVKKWILDRSVPSYIKEGIFLFNLSMVESVEVYLKQKLIEQKELVDAFCEAYPAQKEASKGKLNGQYRELDYPITEDMKKLFGFSWNWIQFGIPENLPKEIFEAEKEKAEKLWAEATEQITFCLRESFKKLIEHAVDRLRTSPGEKPKVFRDSLITNIRDFIETFNTRNLTNDVDLKILIEKSREILTNATGPETLRGNEALRNYTAKQFDDIKTTLDTMITERPSRKFAFDE